MSSSSPPPTPPAEVPKTPTDERFKPSVFACEWAEAYRPGGFHPVKFGDILASGKYRVIRKLGNGSFSTVWLGVSDGANVPKYVAIKVMTANQSVSAASAELQIGSALSAGEGNVSPAKHVLLPLDHFDEEGPNGTHRCFVYDPMGSTVASGVHEIPQYRDVVRKMHDKRRYPKWMVKIILKHTLLGLSSLHGRNLIHSDLQPGNLLFAIHGLNEADEAELVQTVGDTTDDIKRLDGKVDRWSPPYLALGQSLHKYADFSENLEIKISDLGAAFFQDQPPTKIVTPFSLRAPEIILKQKVDENIDIWSFGCLVYELITNTQLFPVAPYGEGQETEEDDDHLLALNDILGDLSSDIMALWPRSGRWFGPDGERLNPRAELPADDDLFNPELHVDDSLETLFGQNKPDDVDEAESAVIIALIRRILNYDPALRPTAEELLEDPWFHSK
ncbi:serine protein kinase [Ilyonectria sp. MPI-CAGE-AT-0026]|nr:serine protein kinase [Ilyonectria sp. MPI-CAGE-AT-0026]